MTSATRALVVETASPEETRAVGAAFGRSLLPGAVLSLEGGLGAGKTTLVRGICQALGVEDPVTSPTYALRHDYVGRDGLDVLHVDCFRLEDGAELESLALEDARRQGAIVLVEWGDRAAAALPEDTLHVRIETADGGARRRIRILVPPGVDVNPEEIGE